MKLYEVPRNTYVKVVDDPNGYYFFDHADGMYSLCTDIDDNIVHLGASTEVEIIPKPTW